MSFDHMEFEQVRGGEHFVASIAGMAMKRIVMGFMIQQLGEHCFATGNSAGELLVVLVEKFLCIHL